MWKLSSFFVFLAICAKLIELNRCVMKHILTAAMACCVLFGPGRPERTFVKHVLTKDFISEGVAIADVNRDGKPDILAGAYWFEGPDWIRHELAPPKHYDPSTQFSNSFLDFSLDVNL